MSSSCTSSVRSRHLSFACRFLGPIRARVRLVLALGWTLVCYAALKSIMIPGVFSRPLFVRLRKGLMNIWAAGVRRIMGMRVIVKGTPPARPCFVVTNHIAWLDFYGLIGLLDTTNVVEEPMGNVPIIGTLIAATEPIFVRRVKEDTARVKGLMVDALREGRGLLMAPETPETTIRRGSGVRMFRGGLLDAALMAETPVHYISITYRTPEGYPPPSKCLVFGPNPNLRGPDGRIPESEYAMYERQTFLQHLLKALSLPYFDFVVTFGNEGITGDDRIELANKLHDAVEKIFIPIE